MFYLLETPVGLALFKKGEQSDSNTIENKKLNVAAKKLFDSSIQALEVYQAIEEGRLHDFFRSFLQENLPASSSLYVMNADLAHLISTQLSLNAVCNSGSENIKITTNIGKSPSAEFVNEFKYIMKNAFKYFNVPKDVYQFMTKNLANNMVGSSNDDIIVIDLLNSIEEMDVSINNRVMRMREWYSIHFPELNTVSDYSKYLKYVLAIGNRSRLEENIAAYKNETCNPETEHEEIPENILFLARNSMGTDIKDSDMEKIRASIVNILADIEYKSQTALRLKSKVASSYPNLHNLVGEFITAKLLRKACSLSNLSQMPSSTVQILGAEKAFNEAIKAQANTPKYGFIYDSNVISKIKDTFKGKVARMLANKISLCCRVDLDYQNKKATKTESATESKDQIEGRFGLDCRLKIEREIEKLEARAVKSKEILQKKKKIVSVKEYDSSRDAIKKKKTN